MAKKGKQGEGGGRPSPYQEAYNIQVYKLCLLGATDKDIADFFNVCEATVNNWKDEHPKFLESIREGKQLADMEVAHSLYESAKDRTRTVMKPVKLKEVFYDDRGKRVEKETVELHPEELFVPADHRSQSLWLRNRQPDKWRDKQEIDHTTNGKPIKHINLGGGEAPEVE